MARYIRLAIRDNLGDNEYADLVPKSAEIVTGDARKAAEIFLRREIKAQPQIALVEAVRLVVLERQHADRQRPGQVQPDQRLPLVRGGTHGFTVQVDQRVGRAELAGAARTRSKAAIAGTDNFQFA